METSMGLQRIERSRWTGVCAAVSIGLLGKRAQIEVVSPVDGLLIEAHQLPVIGIAYDAANDALRIMMDGVDHFVFQPRELYLESGFGGVQSLGILDQENAWQIVLLRDPLMLPNPAAIDARAAAGTKG
jgi:hypothetical protein